MSKRIFPPHHRETGEDRIDLYFDSTLRPEMAHYLWEHLDKTGRFIEGEKTTREKFRLYPFLNLELAENFARGVYTVEQISRHIELYFLKLDKTEVRWAPALLLVPVASYRKQDLAVEFKIIFDRSLSPDGFENVKPLIEQACQESIEGIFQWIINDLATEPIDLEEVLQDEDTGILDYSHYFEQELRYRLFEMPLQSESHGFSPENANRYVIHWYIKRIIAMLCDTSITGPLAEKFLAIPGKDEPAVIQEVLDNHFRVLPQVHLPESYNSDLYAHYIRELKRFIKTAGTHLSRLVPEKSRELLALAPDSDTITEMNTTELHEKNKQFLAQAVTLVREVDSGTEPGTESNISLIMEQVELLKTLHHQMESYIQERTAALTFYRQDQLQAQVLSLAEHFLVLEDKLFPEDHFIDHTQLNPLSTSIREHLISLPGILSHEQDGKVYLAHETNIFRIYSSYKKSNDTELERIAWLMMGQLSQEKGKSVEELMEEMSYSHKEQHQVTRNLVARKEKTGAPKPSITPRIREHILPVASMGLVTSLLGFSLIVILTHIPPGYAAALAVIPGFLAIAATNWFLKRLDKPAQDDSLQHAPETAPPPSMKDRELSRRFIEILQAIIPGEAVPESRVLKEIAEAGDLRKHLPQGDNEDDDTYAARIIEKLIKKGVMVRLPLSPDICYMVFADRWNNHFVRASFEQEVKRLYEGSGKKLTFDEYRWSIDLCRKASSPQLLKKYIRDGTR